jgi:hypothetical protein
MSRIGKSDQDALIDSLLDEINLMKKNARNISGLCVEATNRIGYLNRLLYRAVRQKNKDAVNEANEYLTKHNVTL